MSELRVVDGEMYGWRGVVLIDDAAKIVDTNFIKMSWADAERLQEDLQDLIWAYHDRSKGQR